MEAVRVQMERLQTSKDTGQTVKPSLQLPERYRISTTPPEQHDIATPPASPVPSNASPSASGDTGRTEVDRKREAVSFDEPMAKRPERDTRGSHRGSTIRDSDSCIAGSPYHGSLVRAAEVTAREKAQHLSAEGGLISSMLYKLSGEYHPPHAPAPSSSSTDAPSPFDNSGPRRPPGLPLGTAPPLVGPPPQRPPHSIPSASELSSSAFPPLQQAKEKQYKKTGATQSGPKPPPSAPDIEALEQERMQLRNVKFVRPKKFTGEPMQGQLPDAAIARVKSWDKMGALDELGNPRGGYWAKLGVRGQYKYKGFSVTAATVLRHRVLDQNPLHGSCIPFTRLYFQFLRGDLRNLQWKNATDLGEFMCRGAGTDQKGEHDKRRFEVYYLDDQHHDFLPALIRVIKGHSVVECDRSQGTPVTPAVVRFVFRAALSKDRVSTAKKGVLTGFEAGAKSQRPETYFIMVHSSFPVSHWWHDDNLCPCGPQRGDQQDKYTCIDCGLGESGRRNSPYLDKYGKSLPWYNWNPYIHDVNHRGNICAMKVGNCKFVQVDSGVVICDCSIPACALVSCYDPMQKVMLWENKKVHQALDHIPEQVSVVGDTRATAANIPQMVANNRSTAVCSKGEAPPPTKCRAPIPPKAKALPKEAPKASFKQPPTPPPPPPPPKAGGDSGSEVASSSAGTSSQVFAPKPAAVKRESEEVLGDQDSSRPPKRKTIDFNASDPDSDSPSGGASKPKSRGHMIISETEGAPRSDVKMEVKQEPAEELTPQQRDLHEQLQHKKHAIIFQSHLVLGGR